MINHWGIVVSLATPKIQDAWFEHEPSLLFSVAHSLHAFMGFLRVLASGRWTGHYKSTLPIEWEPVCAFCCNKTAPLPWWIGMGGNY